MERKIARTAKRTVSASVEPPRESEEQEQRRELPVDEWWVKHKDPTCVIHIITA